MSAATYKDVRDSAVKQIGEHFSDLPNIHIAAHPGSFDVEELRRLATKTPAILTSLIRISDQDTQDESWCDFVSWVLYRANNKDTLYDGALQIVSGLIPVIRTLNDEWCINSGTNIEAECLYSGTMDRMNVTMWAVRWRWQVRGASIEGGILLPDDLDYFEGYDADHFIGTQEIKDEVHLEVNHADSNEANSG
jgi:hypothetical protein